MIKTSVRDPFLLVALAITGVLGLAYVLPNLVEATRLALRDWAATGLWLCVIAGCWSGFGQLDRRERLFWAQLALALLVLMAAPLTLALLPDLGRQPRWDAATGVLHLAFSLIVLLAIDVRPHQARAGSFADHERRLRSAGLTLAGFFGLAYYIVTFVVADVAEYRAELPSIGLFLLLDLIVLGRFLWMRRRTRCVRWAALYGGLGAAIFSAGLVDVIEGLRRLDLVPGGSALDVVRALPPVLLLFAVRARHAPVPAGQRVLDPPLPAVRWRAGHLLLGLALVPPLAHFLIRATRGSANGGRWLPELVALAGMVMLGGLALAAYRVLERDRARMEEKVRRLVGKLALARQTDAAARLAGSVAHDFNNLIQIVRGRADIIALRLDPSDPMADDLDEIRAATTRASHLASQLTTSGRRPPAAPATVSLHDLIVRAQPMLAPLLNPQVRLHLQLRAAADLTRLDPMQFERVLVNLVINARDAMPAGGTLTIATSNPTPGGIGGAPAARGRVRLTVSDTGIGMDAATMSRVFEPFFSTKGTPGAGLGLAIVHSLVEQFGGSISVDSRFGGGTVITLSLPVLEAPVPAVSIPAVPPAADRLGAVLIVDGGAANRQVLGRLLAQLGRPILASATAAEAIQIASGGTAPIDLAVIDVSIENGCSLAGRLRETQSSLRAVLLTQDERIDLDDRDVRLREPFGLADVLLAAGRLAN